MLNIVLQNRRNAKAVQRVFRTRLKGLQYTLRLIVIDQLKSEVAAKCMIVPNGEHRQSRYLNN